MFDTKPFLRWASAVCCACSAFAVQAKDADLQAACNATENATTLRAQASADAFRPLLSKTQALWADARSLGWSPGVQGAASYVLAHNASGQLRLQDGKLVDADQVVKLASANATETTLALAQLPWLAKANAAKPKDLAVLKASLSDAQAKRMHQGQTMVLALDAQGKVLAASNLQAALALDALYAKAENVPDLGSYRVRPGAGQFSFKLWAPTAQQVTLCTYASGATSTHRMARSAQTGVWQAQPKAALDRQLYTYLVDVFVPGVGIVRNRVTDPYSLSFNANSARSAVIDLRDADLKPQAWTEREKLPQSARVRSSTDMVIYELHVRDFSITDATVPERHRGKFSAFTQRDSDGMKHLRALSKAGMTDVHFLPIFDIATIPEVGCAAPKIEPSAPDGTAQQAAVAKVKGQDCFNWGYDPFHYTAPEGSYATDANDPAIRVRELREMVLALNREGLRVGMDVVYNHTPASGQDAKSVLDRVVPGYYQRLNLQGGVETSTCCANTATEHKMMAKLMIDSAVTWVQEYGVDSFRFDLMGHQPRSVMERLQTAVNRAAKKPVQLIGEGWNFGEVENGARFVQASQLSLNGSGIGTFSDRARDAVRGGSWADDSAGLLANQGWANGFHFDPTPTAPKTSAADLAAKADQVRVGLAGTLRNFRLETASGAIQRLEEVKYGGAPAGYASQPSEVVNYVDNHDNPTLFDINAFKMPPSTLREDRARAQVVGIAVTALSQGIAYFHAGVETLRSKSLDRNSYDSGDWFNRVDWTLNDNYFGTGLPIEADNGNNWAVMRPLLANPLIKPQPEHIRFAFAASLDLLKIRASSKLFRMDRTQDVMDRLKFHNTGAHQIGSVIVGDMDGKGFAGANFQRVVYAINADKVPQTLTLPALRGAALELHPVHRAAEAADARIAKDARFEAASGQMQIPGRSAVVWVLP
jgi:pullulanase